MTAVMPQAADLRTVAVAALGLAMPDRAADRVSATTMLRDCVVALRAAPPPGDAVVVRMADRLRLCNAELLAFALLAAIEVDAALARAVATAQAPVAGSRATVALLAAAVAPVGGDVATLAFGRAVEAGLLALGDESAALPERSLAPHLPTVAALAGHVSGWEGVVPAEPETLALPQSWLAEASRWARILGRDGGLAVRAASMREALATIQAVTAELGHSMALVGGAAAGAATVVPAGLAAWLLATGSMPVFEARLAPGESWAPPALAGWDGPWFVAVEGEGAVTARDLAGEWTLRMPGAEDRARLWQEGGLAPALADRAGATFRQGAARIASAVTRARFNAIRRGSSDIDWPDVTDALHAHAGPLDALARRVGTRVDDAALVLDATQTAALAALADRCRLREHLGRGLGPAVTARYGPGVRALLHGPSGTGKTLAASWLAGRLGLPLHRVDLAALTSKWIGETEKNLSAVLSAAEHADVVLFFDEADALFAARSDGGEANDRFANAQTNYLLQRIESFDGVALLASNAKDRFDPAFLRRLDAVIAFDPPDAVARRRLWAAHLGDAHVLDAAALDRLAVAVELAGGHVRNAVLAAAARAAAAKRRIGWADLSAAIKEEYVKLGRPPPSELG